MNNRINGDFDTTTLEAFRAAYASREITPEDLEVDQYTGLPTDTVTNISPWIAHTGLWKANPGTDRAFVPNQPLELSNEIEDEELSEDEFNRMVDEVLSDLEEEERFADRIFNSDDDGDDDDDSERDDEEEDGEEEESMGDDELEALIAEILAEAENDGESEETGESEATGDEIEALINEIMAEIDEEAPEDDSDGSIGEVSNDELEEMIGELDSSNPDEQPEVEPEVDPDTETKE